MAAPTVTARVIPTGFKMPDGFKTTIAFASNAAIQFWEETVKAPGLEGGGEIDTTTMLNVAWRTKDAKKLKTLVDCTFTAMFDPDCWSGIVQLLNAPTSITIHFPDNSTLAFYGYLSKADFQEFKEGQAPKLQGTITPTNWDPVNFVEQGPVFAAAAGT